MKKIQRYILLTLLFTGVIMTVGCSKKVETVASPVTNCGKTSMALMEIEIPEVELEEKEEVIEEETVEQPVEEPKKEEQKPTTNTNTSTVTTKSSNPYYIKVNRLANCVTIYSQDENGNYTVPVKAMICSVGKNINNTPTGVFTTSDKYTWRYLYGNQYGQYATRITGHILFHSVPYSSQSKNTLKTDYYNNLGVGDSMGCIRLTCADAKWIYDNCPKGTKVEIYDSSDPGPLGKPTAMQIDVNSPYAGWDPTDPDSANPWKTAKPTISGVADMTVMQGTEGDYISLVSAKDVYGVTLDVVVSGSVDWNVCGEYTITYTATDARGNTTTATASVIVQEVENESAE